MSGRSVVVTGGFGALGRAVATAFTKQGDRVARIDFAPAPSEPPADGFDVGGIDLADERAAGGAIRLIVDRLGGIDVLINIAGGFVWQPIDEGGIPVWRRMFEMNLLSTVNVTSLALPLLRQASAGRIVNVGAGAAVQAGAGMGAYAASKAGVHKMTEALASELAGTATTVNAVLPSIIDTPTNRADMPDADHRIWVQPDAVADVVLFLASPSARAVHGALIPVARGDVV